MYTVKSPVEGYSGTSAGVKFTGGVGVTDNSPAAEWLQCHGYEVTKDKPVKPDKDQKPPKAADPAKEPPPQKSETDSKKGGKA